MATSNSYPSHGSSLPNGYSDLSQQSPQATAAAALRQNSGNVQTNGRKRKAPGVPGSRGVANLTPEQLAKKRANDREAQRAIRERTKNTIETLERRIRELESQQPFQELQRVIVERDNALRECDALKRRLATVAQVIGSSANAAAAGAPAGLNGTSAIGDLLDPSWLNEDGAELAALGAQQPPLPTSASPSLGPYAPASQAGPYPSHSGNGNAFNEAHVHPDLRSPAASYSSAATPLTHGSPKTASTQQLQGESTVRKWSTGLAALNTPQATATSQPSFGQANGGSYDHQQGPPPQLSQQQGNQDRCDLNFLLDSRNSPNGQPPPSSGFSQQSIRTASPPLYSRLPINHPPNSPLDSLLTDFVASCHRRINAGAPIQEVAGPEYPNFTVLADPSASSRHPSHPVSKILIDILSKFPDIAQLPEKIAVLYIMFLITRWFICPCEGCFTRLPEWVRPVVEQLERPHALWNDYLPWPFMRKSLVNSPVKFEDFFVPYTRTLSLNWPLTVNQTLIPDTSPTATQGTLKINPAFEMHLRDLNNWSLGPEFQKAFPDLVDDEMRIANPTRAFKEDV